MSTHLEPIKQAQQLYKKYAVEGSSWSEQLISDRRWKLLGSGNTLMPLTLLVGM